MFVSEALKTHFETSATIQSESLIISEWNMNIPDNIKTTGNYRYRPLGSDEKYRNLPIDFDISDTGNYYTGATDADIVIDGGFEDDGTPQTFTSNKEKMKMLYSLEDCLKQFRPRSGINKKLFFNNQYFTNSGKDIAKRPRYYISSKYDNFKYWTSYRTEQNIERGISNNSTNGLFYIEDAVPFVVYKEKVPANRIIIKMQTNVGSVDLGPFTNGATNFLDPFYGDSNKTTPSRWKIQYLKDNNWVEVYSFNENSLRDDGTQIIGSDGYIELQYGLIIPEEYKEKFIFAERLSSFTLLPQSSIDGYSYLIVENTGDIGTFYVWNSTTLEYDSFIPTYGWSLQNEDITNKTGFVTDLTSPDLFNDELDGDIKYREFSYVEGLRVVVETMNKSDSTFDLIELSPRLVANISEKVIEFSVKKPLSDLGNMSLPVGQLLVSTGTVSLFDEDQAFNSNNSNSLVANYLRKNIKFNFYEKILDVDGYDYFVPIKTLYSDGFPQADKNGGMISIGLRDFYFFLESITAPKMLTTQTSLSYAISLLLDSIGFSNYKFYRVSGETDPIIPYFFIPPDMNVAEVLNQLAISTQTSMFFDEYNNFIVMSKDYLLPDSDKRDIDFELSGNNSQLKSGIVENLTTGTLPNILSIASEDKKIFNDGKINYTMRYIQRSYGSIKQSSMIDKDKTWIYKPVLLWEVSGTDTTKTVNEVASKQGSYVLGAMPLNSDVIAEAPSVINGSVSNNIIDFGENIYWLTRYNGYFYSNGEIIKYDAAQFNITGTGNVWITSNQEYQNYFSSLPFNGKIYPTGLVRISSTPYTEVIDGQTRLKDGALESHGRGQFGTEIAYHSAGVGSYWLSNDYVRSCNMKSQYIFNTSLNLESQISVPSSSGTIFYTPDISNVEIGQTVTIISGTGLLQTTYSTIVTAIDNQKLPEETNYSFTVNYAPTVQLQNATVKLSLYPNTVVGSAGIDNIFARQTTRNSIVKNFMSTNYLTETETNNLNSTQAGTIQSSALVMNGPTFDLDKTPLNYISYVYKNLNNSYKHFGTRLRIIGKVQGSTNKLQIPNGSTPYYQVAGTTIDKSISIGGGSGGLAVLLNPETNNGYYFEIVALTEDNISDYLQNNDKGEATKSINNVVFYKIKKDLNSNDAIPVKLWGGMSKILVDDGRFTGQYRMAGEENPTVYDLSVEYEDLGQIRRFYLYINNQLIKIVDDSDPLPIYNNMALFIRGSSRCMFENIYSLSENYSQNTVFTVSEPISSAFGNTQINANESFRKYAMSGMVKATYMSGISSQQPPKYNMYFEEFGTIMRECSYFNIKYDRAWPALYAQLSPTFNKTKGYVVSGFYADSYGAEFLIFNSTDTALNLDETTGNYLRIQGVTFTQDTTQTLSVDDYFEKNGNLSNIPITTSSTISSALIEQERFNDIKLSRMEYGKNEFSIDAQYIQTEDDAKSLMSWIINKLMKPKKSIGVNVFPIPTIQLGDIVTVNYKNENGLNMVSLDTDRFVVYNIEYSKNLGGPTMTLYLSEV